MHPILPSQDPRTGSFSALWKGALALILAFPVLAIQAATSETLPATPKEFLETGAPAFVVLGPEALGMGSAPIDIQSMPDGRMLVTSQEDIAFGDGVRWETYHPRDDEARSISSIAVDEKGTIYTGIDGGFATVDLTGDARWHLRPALMLGEEIAAQNASLISVSALPDNWYWYGGNGVIVAWRPGRVPQRAGHLSGINRIFSLGKDVYVSDDSSGGLFRLTDDGSLTKAGPEEMSVSSGVTCAAKLTDDLLLVGTGSSGVKRFDGEKFSPFGHSQLLGKGFRITDICAVGGDCFAAAVDSLGIVFFDREGNLVQVLERTLDHRLARVRKLCYSKNGVLWALLNDGIARVLFPSPVSNFEPLIPSGLKYARPLRHDGALWVFADGRALRGTYGVGNRLTGFVDDTPHGSYLFTLTDIAGTLFGANEEGIFVRGDSGWRLALPGIRNARLGVAASQDGICYVARGEYGIIRKQGDDYVADRNTMPGLGDSYGSVVDASGAGWIELGTSLVARCTRTSGGMSLETYGPSSGLAANGWIEIYELSGVARFHVSGHLYRYDEASQTFHDDEELLKSIPQMAQASGRPVIDASGRLWCTIRGVMTVIDLKSPGFPLVDVQPINFSPTSYTVQEDGVVWMFERGHLARIDPRVVPPAEVVPEALITSVHFGSRARDVINPGGNIGEIPYSDNSIIFNFAAPANPFSSPVRFEVDLEGARDRWVSTGTAGTAVFNRLKEDKYVFHVRPVVGGRIMGKEATVAFRVMPPWYRTPIAWFAYCVGTIAVFVFVVWLSSYLQRRENERLERLVAQRTGELSTTNSRLEQQIEETVVKSTALALSEERYRLLNSELEERVRQRAAELEDLHKQLVATSRKAGMAEVATGVLHNVGNVLNSVNVSANLVRETLKSSEIGSLERAADLLRQHEADIGSWVSTDPKGRLLPNFIIQLTHQLRAEHEVIARESMQLSKNVEHIKGVVAMQQSYATVSGVQEEVALAELVRDALHMHSSGLTRHGIRIDCEFEELPPMLIDKHKVIQILVNLIKNAKHAISDAHREDGRIVVKIEAGDADRARISISDNGVGIPPENLVKIFSHGFTTKSGGHGFGLHSGALAARELGGALHAESAGSDRGAKFILELPITAAKAVS